MFKFVKLAKVKFVLKTLVLLRKATSFTNVLMITFLCFGRIKGRASIPTEFGYPFSF